MANYYTTHITRTSDPKTVTKNKLERGMVVKMRYKKADGVKNYVVLILQPDFGMFVLIFCAWLTQICSSSIKMKIILPIILGFLLIFIILVGHIN